jgi:hypothetical protein
MKPYRALSTFNDFCRDTPELRQVRQQVELLLMNAFLEGQNDILKANAERRRVDVTAIGDTERQYREVG